MPRMPTGRGGSALEQTRLDEYKRKLADAIHQANGNCCYTSNWSWAISQRDPRTAPDFADTLSGDVGAGSSQDALYACRFASLMLSAQEHTPHDVMSAIYPKPIRTLPRMLQEGGLVMSSGSSWFLWVNQLAPEQFSHLRTCYGLVDARREALGRTHSLNPVAVLLSETSWEHGLTSPEPGYFDSSTPRNLAFALQDAHYGVDVVNEQTLREQISHWRMVVLANQRQVSRETMAVLKKYVEQGGTLVVTDGSLRSGEQDSPEAVELLGVSRTGWKDQGRQSVDIGGHVGPCPGAMGGGATRCRSGGSLSGAGPADADRSLLGKGPRCLLGFGEFSVPRRRRHGAVADEDVGTGADARGVWRCTGSASGLFSAAA